MPTLTKRLIPLAFSIATLSVQAAELQELPLDDLAPFRDQAGNWRIVGAVSMDPRLDPEESDEAVISQPGDGILLNLNNDEQEDHIITEMQHGDIELSLEMMIPRHSNSGLFLQGRYELQLFDSWGVLTPSFSDMGGIYRNWKSEPSASFRGIAPRANASKAPGLWQTLHLKFRAPRFDDQGRKIANAKFDFVDLNGFRIHENLAIPKLTGGAVSDSEAPTGPLMIQGDHGPIAFRNIRYALLDTPKVELENLAFTAYDGAFASASELDSAEPIAQGSTPGLNAYAGSSDDKFGLRFTGELVVDEADEYSFDLRHNGGVLVTLDGETLFDRQNPSAQNGREVTEKQLQAGRYPIEISHYKDVAWAPPRLALSVKGSQTHELALHTSESFPVKQDVTSRIYVDVGRDARLHRGFFDANGKRYSHTLAVGDPSGLHYVIDLESAAILAGWRGDFIDATPMWHDRGNGTYTARGVTESFIHSSPFPPADGDRPKLLGFERVGKLGRPVFRYLYQSNEYLLSLTPGEDGKKLLVALELPEDSAASPFTLRLAQNDPFEALSDGLYAIDGRRYFVEILDAGKRKPKPSSKNAGLQIPFHGKRVAYALIW